MDRTHVVPFFTRRDADGREQTVCGQYVTADQLARVDHEPTCLGCAMWLREVVRAVEFVKQGAHV